MPPTTDFSFGDVVLVPFPLTDQSGTKKRPAVIVSSAAYNTARRDLVIMAVTSQLKHSGALGEPLINRHTRASGYPEAVEFPGFPPTRERRKWSFSDLP